jgi:tetratricopeptide (TPR) repeat protein
VAAFYQTQQVPEMAAYYYRLAGNGGIPQDRLQAILLTADAGAHDSAYAQLMRFRVDYPEFRQPAEQEMNLLARGYGDEFILLNWPLTREQKLRLGIYAGAAGQPGYSSTVYNGLVEQDSQWVAPYIQLGRIFSTHYGDTLALMQYEAGLKVAKGDPELNAERARCLIRMGRLAEADKLLKDFVEKHGQEPLWQLAQAERLQKAGQIGKARTLLEAAHKLYPFRTDITLTLARLYADTKEHQLGLTLMTEAVRINHQNPVLWARYAYFAARTAFIADALPAMERAIALARNKTEKGQLQAELNDIRTYLLNN